MMDAVGGARSAVWRTARSSVALILALVGLYGLIAYSVACRTQEIGTRMAIGAGRSDVLTMVLRPGLILAAVGILMGGIVSVAVVRGLTASLVGLGTVNPVIYVAVPVLVIASTMAATYVPARRAAQTDPLLALRHD